MSHILKALNQADAERRRGQPPDPLASGPGQDQRPRNRTVLAVLSGALALNAGVIAALFATGVLWTDKPDPAPTSVPVTELEATAGAGSSGAQRSRVSAPRQPAPSADPIPARGQPSALPRRPLLAETEVVTKTAPGAPEPSTPGAPALVSAVDRRSPPAPPSRASAPRLPAPLVPARPAPTAPTNINPNPNPGATAPLNDAAARFSRIPLLHELPEQPGLPSLTLNVIAYSDQPEGRFAIINMHKYFEGDTLVDTDVSLRQVTRDGAILQTKAGLVRLLSGH